MSKTINIDMGDTVLCDVCNEDYTHSSATGGMLFDTRAVCPDCETKVIKDANSYDEMHLVRGHCPAFITFANWIRSMR